MSNAMLTVGRSASRIGRIGPDEDETVPPDRGVEGDRGRRPWRGSSGANDETLKRIATRTLIATRLEFQIRREVCKSGARRAGTFGNSHER